MCEACKHITINARQAALKKADPTRTTMLRKAFENQMKKKFSELKQAIKDAIVTKDVFGLQKPGMSVNVNPLAFDFARSADKVEGFMDWLKEQEQLGLLKTAELGRIGGTSENAWTSLYITDAYERGALRADYEMTKVGFEVPSAEMRGGSKAILATPFHADRLGLLYTRVFNDLKGITDAMNNQISRVLTEAIANGDHPSRIARKLNAVIEGGGADLGITDSLGRFIPGERRARMLARTEIIRAHHIATVQEYRNWGAAGVKVQAEWSALGDACPQCQALAQGGKENNGIYTLDEIEGMIPAHPNCRCMALPYLPAEEEVAEATPVDVEPQWENLNNSNFMDNGQKTNFINATDNPILSKAGINSINIYDGVSATTLKQANTIGETLADDVLAKLPNIAKKEGFVPVNILLDDRVYAYGDGFSLAAYQPARKEISIGTKAVRNKIWTKPSPGSWSVNENLRHYTAHEYGHHLQLTAFTAEDTKTWNVFYNQMGSDYFKKGVSKYGATNRQEAWAESFAYYCNPKYSEKPLPKELESVIEKIVGRRIDL